MSSYERYDTRRRRPLPGPVSSSRRSTLGYWVPLALTVTLATAGLVAWIWSERQDGRENDDDDEDDDNEYTTDEHDPARDNNPTSSGQDNIRSTATGEDDGFFSRMTGAVRRSPSPQQLFDNAGQRLVAGVAAAGAAVGLGSIREEVSGAQDREGGFSDHERWSEEAETKRVEAQTGGKSAATQSKHRRTVAIVVSAESLHHEVEEEDEEDYEIEHVSILSHLTQHYDPSTTRLFVLIYAPHLTSLPAQSTSSRPPPSTLSSSYDAISTPEEEEVSPAMQTASPANPLNRLFDALWTQSLALVDKQSMILPFTTPTGYLHILRHLAPSLVYLSNIPAVSGARGEHVAQLRGWVGQTVIVVGDHSHGGLADTESEDDGAKPAGREGWWENSELVGLGKGIEVVDADRLGDDWMRRLGGKS